MYVQLLTNAAGEAATRHPRRIRFHRPPRDRVQAGRMRHASGRSLRATSRREVRPLPNPRLLGDLENANERKGRKKKRGKENNGRVVYLFLHLLLLPLLPIGVVKSNFPTATTRNWKRDARVFYIYICREREKGELVTRR